MELFDIVMKLNGPISPMGESNADEKRLKNTETLLVLYRSITDELVSAAKCADDYRTSMKEIGQLAKKGLQEVKEEIKHT